MEEQKRNQANQLARECMVQALIKLLDTKPLSEISVTEIANKAGVSRMYLYPDLDTFEIFPWRPQNGKVARLVCDVYMPDGKPFEGDPRHAGDISLNVRTFDHFQISGGEGRLDANTIRSDMVMVMPGLLSSAYSTDSTAAGREWFHG